MYDRYGSTKSQRGSSTNGHRHFTFSEEDIEEIYRQFFAQNSDLDPNDADFIFSHLFNTKPPPRHIASSSIESTPFRFASKSIYYVKSDRHHNQRIESNRVRNPFEKSNREYAREILEIIRYLLQSLPFQFRRDNAMESQLEEYHLLKLLIDSEHRQRYHFSAECVALAQRLYNLRTHLCHWTRSKKQMSFKSINHYFIVALQFIAELRKQRQFGYYHFTKHFKCAQLNMDVLHQQFMAHKSRDRAQRKKYGDLRGSLDASYRTYNGIISTRAKWFIAGVVSTCLALIWLVRNVDLDDEPYDDYEPHEGRHSEPTNKKSQETSEWVPWFMSEDK